MEFLQKKIRNQADGGFSPFFQSPEMFLNDENNYDAEKQDNFALGIALLKFMKVFSEFLGEKEEENSFLLNLKKLKKIKKEGSEDFVEVDDFVDINLNSKKDCFVFSVNEKDAIVSINEAELKSNVFNAYRQQYNFENINSPEFIDFF